MKQMEVLNKTQPKKILPGKTLVIGSQSYIGKQFYATYQQLYPDTLGTHYKTSKITEKLDLLDPKLENLSLLSGEYKWAIIAAANTNLLRCEEERKQNFRVNVEGTSQLVQALVRKEIIPIILSSDYVFDGIEGGYQENSIKNPINEYGKQKDLLEEAVVKICNNNCLIIRCSKIFGLNQGDNTLIDQMITPLSLKQPIKAAYDQFFAPIYEEDVVRAVIKLQTLDCRGLFNLCGTETWSRLDLARAIGKLLLADEKLIEPISLDDLKIPYKLPKHTYMNCIKFKKTTEFKITPLSECLKRLEAQYMNAWRRSKHEIFCGN